MLSFRELISLDELASLDIILVVLDDKDTKKQSYQNEMNQTFNSNDTPTKTFWLHCAVILKSFVNAII